MVGGQRFSGDLNKLKPSMVKREPGVQRRARNRLSHWEAETGR